MSGFSLPSILSKSPQKRERSAEITIADQSIRNYFSSFPSEKELSEVFGSAFVINQPMSSVGGDGYWAFQTSEYAILVVFDCMGHGRFASMMTRFYLRVIYDEIVHQKNHVPHEILSGIHRKVKEEFGNVEKHPGSGADVGVLVFDKAKNNLLFSGAKMDLIEMKNGELNRIRGHRRPVGEYFDFARDYDSVQLDTNDLDNSTFYLYSDGVTDLIGGPKNKRLGFQKVSELLKENHQSDFGAEKKNLIRSFDQWLGSNDPLDDVLLIGLRITR